MPLKEIFPMMMRSFCVIVTGILAFFWFIGSFCAQNDSYAVLELGRILIISFVAILFFLIFYSNKELTSKQMKIRVVIHFFAIAPTTIFLGVYWKWFSIESSVQIFSAVLCFLFIYMIVFWRVFIKGLKDAKMINDALEKHKQDILR